MKTKKLFVLLLIMSMVLAAFAACGGSGGSDSSDSAVSTRADRAGFNSETNQVIEVGGYSFEIPDYYVLNEENSGEGHTDYQIEGGEAIVRFAAEKMAGTTSEFEEAYDTLLDGMATGIAEDAERNGNYFTATVNGDLCSGKVEAYYNEELSTMIYAIFMQREDSSADYLPDWEKVLSSKKTIDTSEPEQSKSEPNETESSDDGLLSPEFKKTMDDYEAWFDHYCEVMNKYTEDPSDLELMSEVADLLTEEQEMLDEMDKMDQSEMNAAELAYYIEVTARIEKKLLEVAY